MAGPRGIECGPSTCDEFGVSEEGEGKMRKIGIHIEKGGYFYQLLQNGFYSAKIIRLGMAQYIDRGAIVRARERTAQLVKELTPRLRTTVRRVAGRGRHEEDRDCE